MVKIRNGTFETNSSSTHAICIHKQKDIIFPNYIYFGLEDLDDYNEYEDLQHRVNYLNTIMYNCCSKTEYINRQKEIKEMLGKYGIKIEWAKVHWDIGGNPDYDLYSIKDSCTSPILNTITKNELLLIQFLFGQHSTVIAGYEDQYSERIAEQKEKYPEGKEYEYLYETY